MALDHDTHDGGLTGLQLLGKGRGNLGLVLVVLERVAVAAVDHQPLLETGFLERSLGLADALRIVVGTTGATAEDDEAVLVAFRADNGNNTRLRDGQEVVGMPDSIDGVHGNTQCAVGSILEADGT